MAAFRDSFFVEIQLTSSASGSVTAKMVTAKEWERSFWSGANTYHGAVAKTEIHELLEAFESTRFWRTPPGELTWYCTDGESSVIETNLGGAYRLWSNSCEPSHNMEIISKPFFRIAQRLSAHEIS
jgi:hypothetical protein